MLKNNLIIFTIILLAILTGCNKEISPQNKETNSLQGIKKTIVKKDIKIKKVVEHKIIDSIVWDGTNEYISSSDYDKAIKNYINNKYPKKVKKWEKEVKRKKKINLEKIKKEIKARLKKEAKEKKIRLAKIEKDRKINLKREAKEKKARLKREKKEERDRDIAYYTKKVDDLMWEDHPDATTNGYSWSAANKYCTNMSWLGYTDWRLPTFYEFEQLYTKQHRNKLQHFQGSSARDYKYWTSTNGDDIGKCTSVSNGVISVFYTSGSNTKEIHFARCVRKIRR